MDLYSLSASYPKGQAYSSKDLYSYKTEWCPCCYRSLPLPPVNDNDKPVTFVLEDTKREFPDFLFCGGSGLSVGAFIVSGKAMEAFIKAGVSGCSYSKIRLVADTEEDGIYEDACEAPEYYLAEISGVIDIDYAQMHLKKKHLCEKCGQFSLSRQKLGVSYLDEDLWNGLDICRLICFPAKVICTQKVIDTIKSYKLRGASVSDSAHIFMARYDKEIIIK